ncbi:SDR family oxidoreductase [Actinophytocola algeriensis]|uniref:NAD(P)-dependent dehydrogenase (Short-subunit alcohol dehydrogenase family) n=1 Tax=Actinophytocola algeriensis TaxID=1768010 RepID=A0A7W7Q0R6_9PSEU|nr:SDR family oxidoreductase [Actinophytocola algeriensis]MBB4904854.1 NAD(P)-dependent dehydrogenase (short-subunit alcohol dehydrogenase family) [Actinophytocola algeriensis]MBE1476287.1 NAD(P)-dependent dehydrogenase (short-subunit alcohol dehydrogenase family) [Actinophytocola algeriensis]
MKIEDSVALVTGANRGLGRHFAEALLRRGAKVYATARNPEAVDLPGVEVLRLDVTDPRTIAAAAAAAPDVTLLVNNAGTNTFQNLVAGDRDKIRLDMDTHFYGTLDVVRAFAPVLTRNGGGAILNVLSAMSWFAFDGAGSYGAAKSAQWGLTNSIRLELAPQGIAVTGLHLSSTDTEMVAAFDIPKTDPADVVATALDGVEAGLIEIIADSDTAVVKAALAGDPAALYAQLA